MAISGINNAAPSPAAAETNSSSMQAQAPAASQPVVQESAVVKLSDDALRLDVMERMKQGQPMSADDINRVFNDLKPGTTYIGSNGSTITVGDPRDLIATPLSVAWAPQLFVKGDRDGNNKLTLEEFSSVVKTAGVTLDEAKKMFDQFDASDDGTLTVEAFVDGVRSAFDSGDKFYDKVLDSFLRTPDGKIDDIAYKDFMQQGDAVATKYWGARRSAERAELNHAH